LAGCEAGGEGGQRKCGREESFEDGHLETVRREIGGSDRVIDNVTFIRWDNDLLNRVKNEGDAY
jgi:hypothetical protein